MIHKRGLQNLMLVLNSSSRVVEHPPTLLIYGESRDFAMGNLHYLRAYLYNYRETVMPNTALQDSTCKVSDLLAGFCGKEFLKSNPVSYHPRSRAVYNETSDHYSSRSNYAGARETSVVPRIFDAVSRLIWTDPLFTNVVLNWGFDHRLLWKECSRLGCERVKTEIVFVQRKTGINSKGGYLRAILKNIDPLPETLDLCN